jgi:hypothetical protein
MFKMFHALMRAVAPTPRFNDAALSDMTDAQLRRTGYSKAEIVHRTFSGLYYA